MYTRNRLKIWWLSVFLSNFHFMLFKRKWPMTKCFGSYQKNNLKSFTCLMNGVIFLINAPVRNIFHFFYFTCFLYFVWDRRSCPGASCFYHKALEAGRYFREKKVYKSVFSPFFGLDLKNVRYLVGVTFHTEWTLRIYFYTT